MSHVSRLTDALDLALVSRDALALLAYIVDSQGCTTAELCAVAADLGLMVVKPKDGEKVDGVKPGDAIYAFAPHLVASLAPGRERLGQRFLARKN